MEPVQTSPPFTTHSALNAVFATYGANQYSQSFPGAKTPELNNIFEIHLTGNVDSLASVLDSMNLFNHISIADYYNLLCENPAPPVNDTYVQQGWVNNYALDMIEANCAWSVTTGNPNVTVAVIDTDFEIDHEDMANNYISYWGEGSPSSCSWHGTSVAGVVAAETNNNVGIASIGHDIKVAAYAVGFCSGGNLWPAIWQAYQDGHRIINVSWSGVGTTGDAGFPITAAVLEMSQNGVNLVVGAGNEPDNQYHISYANIPGVINVTSVESNNLHGPTGHAHNAHVDICAPGNNVTTLHENNSYGGAWGTSIAAPIVSGTIGLMLSVNPCLSPADVEEILKLTADPVADGASFPNLLGAGRVNAYQAVLMAQNFGIQGNISESTTWDTPTFVPGDIFIQPGVTLTITSDVQIASGVEIHVMQNGGLIVDGGHLKNSTGCAYDLWGGIQVWGDTTKHQYSHSGGQFYQGRAIFRNGAIIENASLGVTNWRPGHWETRGGIIQASSNTKFLNCRRAAAFMAYQNFQPGNINISRPEQSRFIKTTFEINDDYLGDLDLQPVLPRITMWRTDRLSILGCTFINSSTVSNSENRRVAVYSHDANYIINEYCPGFVEWGQPCPNPIPTTFTGWHKGVEALETASGRPIRVGNSIFTENMIGVELNAVDFSEIYSNDFYVGGHPFSNWGNLLNGDNRNHLGIFSNSTHHFAIEQNEFIKPLQNTSSPPLFDAHGVLVYNSQGAENQVYNNEFTRLKTGVNGWQINRNTEIEGGVPVGYAGLQYLCNNNNENEVDFEISRSGTQGTFEFNNSGIRYLQGGKFLSAENTFSPASSDPLVFSHWTIDSDPSYRYYSYPSIAPDPNEIGPDDMDIYTVSANNSCPLNYTTGGLTEKPALLLQKAEYEGLFYTYHQLIDNGNTPATVTAIELTWPQQAWEMRDELMQRAPYNSETVLIAAIDRNIMPHAMLLEVLLANPDALRSGHVIRHAETVPSPPLPEYMIDLLWASRDQSTLRTEMESTLTDLHLELQRLQKMIISKKAFSTDIEPDSTIYYLSQVKTVEGNYSRASAYANRNQYNQAISLLDSMQLSYKLSAERSMEMTALKTLYGTLSVAHQAGQTIANLDSTYIQALITIAENNTGGIAALKAQNALCFHYEICYDAQGQPKNDATPRKPKPTYQELVDHLNTATAYPNPSNQFITIAYTFLHAREQSTLSLFDNLGRQVENRNLGEIYEGQQLIDTRKLANGVYLFQILQEGMKVSEGKFVVMH